jgi:hypothetical protein
LGYGTPVEQRKGFDSNWENGRFAKAQKPAFQNLLIPNCKKRQKIMQEDESLKFLKLFSHLQLLVEQCQRCARTHDRGDSDTCTCVPAHVHAHARDIAARTPTLLANFNTSPSPLSRNVVFEQSKKMFCVEEKGRF